MKEILNLSLRLALICAVAALLLTQVNSMTLEPIAIAENAAEVAAIEAVLPLFDNAPVVETLVTREGETDEVTYHIGIGEGKLVGIAFKAVTYEGYSGEILSMVGVDAEGSVHGIRVLKHAETPGLGSKYADPVLLEEYYCKRSFADTDWRVTKDGGPIDAIAGATVTGRALVGAFNKAMVRYREDMPEILKAASGYGAEIPSGEGEGS